MPALTAGVELDALCNFARGAQGLAARAAARALGKIAMPSEAEHCLYELLQRGNWMVVQAALTSLSGKQTALQDVEPLLAVLEDQSKSVEERLFGFIAMENTATVPVARIREMLPHLHPVLRLLAARCLVAVGDRSCIPVLIELLDTEETVKVDFEDRACARTGARSVLAEIAGEDLGAASEAWQRWHGKFTDMGPVRLRTPAPTFW